MTPTKMWPLCRKMWPLQFSPRFLAKMRQKRVLFCRIREERRPIRAHLQFSVSPRRPYLFVFSGKNASQTRFVLQNTRINKANQGSPTIFRASPKRPYLFVFSGNNASQTCFVLQNTRLNKGNQGSPTIFRVPQEALFIRVFW